MDALDEAGPEENVKSVLQLLLSVEVPFALRLFLTSRPEAHIRLVFENDKHHSHFVLHNIEDSIVQSDIRHFLERKLLSVPKELGISLPEWPSPSELDAVVAKSGRLFIFAATVVRFVADNRVLDPPKRLRQLLHSQTVLPSSVYAQLDQLYLNVLRNAVAGIDEDEYIARLRTILAAIVLLRNPLPVTALATLIDHDAEHVVRSLYHLHSIILAPNTVQDVPRLYHLSFPDFITDSSRCTEPMFYVDVAVQEAFLLLQCLKTMARSLHFNMGAFELTRADLGENGGQPPGSNQDISKTILHDTVPPELAYACQFWCSHLVKVADTTPEIVEQLTIFCFEHILSWMEVMSLLGLVEPARVAMRDAYQWAVSTSDHYVDMKLNESFSRRNQSVTGE